jgi:hypothetical protein
LFQPGTWKVAGTAVTGTAVVSRGHRVYARGTARISGVGKLVSLRLTELHALRRGRYLLTVTIGHGHHRRVLRHAIQIR